MPLSSALGAVNALERASSAGSVAVAVGSDGRGRRQEKKSQKTERQTLLARGDAVLGDAAQGLLTGCELFAKA